MVGDRTMKKTSLAILMTSLLTISILSTCIIGSAASVKSQGSMIEKSLKVYAPRFVEEKTWFTVYVKDNLGRSVKAWVSFNGRIKYGSQVRFLAPDVKEDRGFWVHAKKYGYKSYSIEITVKNGMEIKKLKAATIKGKVIDSEAKSPIAGAKVSVDDGRYVFTDSFGRYSIKVFPDEHGSTYHITAAKKGYITRTIVVPHVKSGQTTRGWFIWLDPKTHVDKPKKVEAVLWGFIRDRNKLPLPGVTVSLISIDGKVYSTVTNLFGFYYLKVKAGVYSISLKKEGYTAILPLSITLKPEEIKHMDFTMVKIDTDEPSKDAVLHVWVKDEKGIPIKDVYVCVHKLPIGEWITDYTDKNGHCMFSLLPGIYSVRVTLGITKALYSVVIERTKIIKLESGEIKHITFILSSTTDQIYVPAEPHVRPIPPIPPSPPFGGISKEVDGVIKINDNHPGLEQGPSIPLFPPDDSGGHEGEHGDGWGYVH
jgi:hypothetical protein